MAPDREPFDELARWAADARAEEAAAGRARERWLRRQAEEEGTVARVLGHEHDNWGAQPRVGVLLNYEPERILYVTEPFHNTIAKAWHEY